MKNKPLGKIIFLLLAALCLLPYVTPPMALVVGLLCGFIGLASFPEQSKKTAAYLLHYSIVGLGFGMNAHVVAQSGIQAFWFTILSVTLVMLMGVLFARWLHIERKLGYLIASGTAICGGSAIAAVGPVIGADKNQMSIALACIFLLNSVAIFLFPPIGHFLELTQQQFGTWAAIAIHDTSSVVGAGAAFGTEALETATTVKLTRALWIIPLALVSALVFKQKGKRVTIPWFILFFVAAILINTFVPLPKELPQAIAFFAHRGLVLCLFLIGTGISLQALRQVGVRALLFAIALWGFIAITSLVVIRQV